MPRPIPVSVRDHGHLAVEAKGYRDYQTHIKDLYLWNFSLTEIKEHGVYDTPAGDFLPRSVITITFGACGVDILDLVKCPR